MPFRREILLYRGHQQPVVYFLHPGRLPYPERKRVLCSCSLSNLPFDHRVLLISAYSCPAASNLQGRGLSFLWSGGKRTEQKKHKPVEKSRCVKDFVCDKRVLSSPSPHLDGNGGIKTFWGGHHSWQKMHATLKIAPAGARRQPCQNRFVEVRHG